MTTEPRSGALEFPCAFPVKAMGRHSEDFEQLVCDIVLRHARVREGQSLKVRTSRNGKFISITLVIEAESQPQLDAIYQALTDCERVLVAL